MDYLSIARIIFDRTKYQATEKDIKKLSDHIALLEKRGFGKLNKRLIDSKRGVWATIAEHNFAVILISRHNSTIPIRYEPDTLQRPPDFKVEIGDITYWIQMKDLANLERENRQDKLIQKIKTKANEIKIGKYFSCMLSDNFKESSLPKLMNFIINKAESGSEEESFLFRDANNQIAEIEFWSAKNVALSELTLGSAGDLGVVKITGLASEQIKNSLRTAVKAFKWKADQKNINLIAMEADGKSDIDICNALFGTEYEKGHRCRREDDGLFKESDFSKKVAGIIALKRKQERFVWDNSLLSEIEKIAKAFGKTLEQYKKECELHGQKPGPIAKYSLILYMNNEYKKLLKDIERLLTYDKIVYYNMRPPWENNL